MSSMETKYIKEQTKCPSANEYTMYLNGKGSEDFILWFDEHLKNCELCNEAVEGYKLNYLLNNEFELPKKVKMRNNFNVKKLLPYAASVAVLIAVFFSSTIKDQLFERNYLAEDAFTNKANYNKKLLHKTSAEYWYISESNNVSLNDQLVSKDDIEASILLKTKSEAVFVQVESTNTKTSEIVISKIKENHSVPVYTYSKQKGLKRN